MKGPACGIKWNLMVRLQTVQNLAPFLRPHPQIKVLSSEEIHFEAHFPGGYYTLYTAYFYILTTDN